MYRKQLNHKATKDAKIQGTNVIGSVSELQSYSSCPLCLRGYLHFDAFPGHDVV